MMIAHQIALDPTAKQRAYFQRAAGVARFAYNWALTEWNRQYEARRADPSLPMPTERSLRQLLTSLKREQFPWMFEVTKCASQEAIIDLGAAFRAFFDKRAQLPRFKKKGDKDRFCAANQVGKFIVDGKRIRLPVVGWVRMREAVRFAGSLKRATVSRQADRWFVSVLIDAEPPAPIDHPNDIVGVDLGVSSLATLSNGDIVRGPKAHRSLLARLHRAHRTMSRKQSGSRNRAKAKLRLARLHLRVANIRRDATHKLTSSLARTWKRIGIERLNVRAMLRNRKLSRAVADADFSEFRRQIEYKAKLYGATVVVADMFFPSSKACSCCGSVKAELALRTRTFTCDDCGFECDRDLNAALNLERLAASSAVTAGGEERSDMVRKSRVKRASAKQEPDQTTWRAA